MMIDFDTIVQWLVTVALALPGIIGFLWKIKDRVKERILMEEKFKTRLKNSFPNPSFDQEYNINRITGNVVIENVGDLEVIIENLFIEIKARGNLTLSGDAFFYKDPIELEIETQRDFLRIGYTPYNDKNFLTIRPKQTLVLPLNFPYIQKGYGDFIIYLYIKTRQLSRFDSREDFMNEIKQLDMDLWMLESEIIYYKMLYSFYNDLYSKSKEIMKMRPVAHQVDYLSYIVYSFLREFKARIESAAREYYEDALTKFSEKITMWEAYEKKDPEQLSAWLLELSKEFDQLIRTEIRTAPSGTKKELDCLKELRTAITIEDGNNYLQCLNDLQNIKQQERQSATHVYERESIDKLLGNIKELSKKFQGSSWSAQKYLETNKKEAIANSFQWEYWDQIQAFYNQYKEKYTKVFKEEKFDKEKVYEFNEIFYVNVPEAMEKSRTVIDFDFEYQIITQDAEKYLLGRVILENKRGVTTKYQGMKLWLTGVIGKPSVKFYDAATNQFESKLDLLKTDIVQDWVYIDKDTFWKQDIQKVQCVTHPDMVETLDFIVKLEGDGFFKLEAELVHAPKITGETEFHNYDYSTHNIESFIGWSGPIGAAPLKAPTPAQKIPTAKPALISSKPAPISSKPAPISSKPPTEPQKPPSPPTTDPLQDLSDLKKALYGKDEDTRTED